MADKQQQPNHNWKVGSEIKGSPEQRQTDSLIKARRAFCKRIKDNTEHVSEERLDKPEPCDFCERDTVVKCMCKPAKPVCSNCGPCWGNHDNNLIINKNGKLRACTICKSLTATTCSCRKHGLCHSCAYLSGDKLECDATRACDYCTRQTIQRCECDRPVCADCGPCLRNHGIKGVKPIKKTGPDILCRSCGKGGRTKCICGKHGLCHACFIRSACPRYDHYSPDRDVEKIAAEKHGVDKNRYELDELNCPTLRCKACMMLTKVECSNGCQGPTVCVSKHTKCYKCFCKDNPDWEDEDKDKKQSSCRKCYTSAYGEEYCIDCEDEADNSDGMISSDEATTEEDDDTGFKIINPLKAPNIRRACDACERWTYDTCYCKKESPMCYKHQDCEMTHGKPEVQYPLKIVTKTVKNVQTCPQCEEPCWMFCCKKSVCCEDCYREQGSKCDCSADKPDIIGNCVYCNIKTCMKCDCKDDPRYICTDCSPCRWNHAITAIYGKNGWTHVKDNDHMSPMEKDPVEEIIVDEVKYDEAMIVDTVANSDEEDKLPCVFTNQKPTVIREKADERDSLDIPFYELPPDDENRKACIACGSWTFLRCNCDKALPLCYLHGRDCDFHIGKLKSPLTWSPNNAKPCKYCGKTTYSFCCKKGACCWECYREHGSQNICTVDEKEVLFNCNFCNVLTDKKCPCDKPVCQKCAPCNGGHTYLNIWGPPDESIVILKDQSGSQLWQCTKCKKRTKQEDKANHWCSPEDIQHTIFTCPRCDKKMLSSAANLHVCGRCEGCYKHTAWSCPNCSCYLCERCRKKPNTSPLAHVCKIDAYHKQPCGVTDCPRLTTTTCVGCKEYICATCIVDGMHKCLGPRLKEIQVLDNAPAKAALVPFSAPGVTCTRCAKPPISGSNRCDEHQLRFEFAPIASTSKEDNTKSTYWADAESRHPGVIKAVFGDKGAPEESQPDIQVKVMTLVIPDPPTLPGTRMKWHCFQCDNQNKRCDDCEARAQKIIADKPGPTLRNKLYAKCKNYAKCGCSIVKARGEKGYCYTCRPDTDSDDDSVTEVLKKTVAQKKKEEAAQKKKEEEPMEDSDSDDDSNIARVDKMYVNEMKDHTMCGDDSDDSNEEEKGGTYTELLSGTCINLVVTCKLRTHSRCSACGEFICKICQDSKLHLCKGKIDLLRTAWPCYYCANWTVGWHWCNEVPCCDACKVDYPPTSCIRHQPDTPWPNQPIRRQLCCANLSDNCVKKTTSICCWDCRMPYCEPCKEISGHTHTCVICIKKIAQAYCCRNTPICSDCITKQQKIKRLQGANPPPCLCHMALPRSKRYPREHCRGKEGTNPCVVCGFATTFYIYRDIAICGPCHKQHGTRVHPYGRPLDLVLSRGCDLEGPCQLCRKTPVIYTCKCDFEDNKDLCVCNPLCRKCSREYPCPPGKTKCLYCKELCKDDDTEFPVCSTCNDKYRLERPEPCIFDMTHIEGIPQNTVLACSCGNGTPICKTCYLKFGCPHNLGTAISRAATSRKRALETIHSDGSHKKIKISTKKFISDTKKYLNQTQKDLGKLKKDLAKNIPKERLAKIDKKIAADKKEKEDEYQLMRLVPHPEGFSCCVWETIPKKKPAEDKQAAEEIVDKVIDKSLKKIADTNEEAARAFARAIENGVNDSSDDSSDEDTDSDGSYNSEDSDDTEKHYKMRCNKTGKKIRL